MSPRPLYRVEMHLKFKRPALKWYAHQFYTFFNLYFLIILCDILAYSNITH